MRCTVQLSSLTRLTAVLLMSTALVACKTSEERAEDHYQSGLALIAEGEADKGLVELRNVFQMDGDHREARELYAKTVLGQGNLREAYGQYLRLVEQYPTDAEGRIVLSELAFNSNSWEEFDRHSKVAIEQAPEDPRTKVIAVAGDYRQAVLADNEPRREAVAVQARALAEETADSNILRRIIIEDLLRGQKFSAALSEIARSIEQDPSDRLLYRQKLAVLNQLRDFEGIEMLLRDMIDRFPEDTSLSTTLIRFYMSQDDIEGAENFLRETSDPSSDDQQGFVTLIRFLLTQRGTEAALAELESGLLVKPNDLILRSLRAGIEFDSGSHEKAISDLEKLVSETTDEDAIDQVNNVKVALARMQISQGNEVGARRLVEEILLADGSQVEALKMRATWEIGADEADAAISSLRAALDQSPQDHVAMTLMAQAYTRAGRRELARDYLSLAVEASGNAPAESLRYAKLLRSEERFLPAEDTLVASLRVSPGNLEVLNELGGLYIAMKDVSRARQVTDTLRRLDTDAGRQAANALDVAILNEREGSAGALKFLEGLAEETGEIGPKVAITRTLLSERKVDQALAYITDAAAESPSDPILKYVLHATQVAAGLLEEAEAGYRELLAEDPKRERIWIELIRLLSAQGRRVDVDAATQAGLDVLPTAPNLLWSKATFLERDGDVDGAIAVYEEMYETLSASPIVANNLASMLTTHRDDAESLERAFNVARRLRGTDVPAFQDTYGWIMYRRGDFNQALVNLEPAAEAMASDPIVQYHLGMTYLAVQRNNEALEQFKRVVALAGEIDTRPQIENARVQVRELEK
jgi:tetratricopeptide (TPR) repeat protein